LFIEILAGDVCFVNLFRSILPVVPTKCDVLIVCRQHNDKEWKFKEKHAKMWENIVGRKDILAPVVSTLRGRGPRRPRRSDASEHRHRIDKYLDTSLANQTAARKALPPTTDKSGNRKMADCPSYYLPIQA